MENSISIFEERGYNVYKRKMSFAEAHTVVAREQSAPGMRGQKNSVMDTYTLSHPQYCNTIEEKFEVNLKSRLHVAFENIYIYF